MMINTNMNINNRRLQDITLKNINNGELTLMELDQIYRKMGFLFEVKEGKFIKVRKERLH